MTAPNSIQIVLAAFFLLTVCGGLVTQAAASAIYLCSRRHESFFPRDSRRLVLILFLFLAIFWALTQLADILLPVLATITCHVIIIFSTLFDQLARITFHQFILRSMEEEDVRSILNRLLLHGTLLIRILGGGVLLGFTLPDFTPTCVARRSNITGSIVVIVLDGLILGLLVTNAFFMLRRDYQRNGSFHVMSRSGASIFGILGFTIWSGTSIPMILGFSDFILPLKTILPAFGLLILIGIIGIFSSYLADSRKEYITSSEASSPFMPPIKPSPNAMKKGAETGSPASGYLQSRNLFVVNPSATPRDSYSPFSFGRKNAKNTATTPKNSISNLSDQGSFTPKFTKNWQFKNYSESNISQNSSNDTPGYRGSSGIFPLHDDNQAALAPAILQDDKIQNAGEITTNTAASPKRNFLKWPSKAITQNKQNIRNLPISKPIVNDGNNSDSESFVRIPTIELEQAVINDRLRRDAQAENLSFSDTISPKQIFPRLLDLKTKNEDDQIQSNNEITAISNSNTQIETVVSAPKSEAAAVTPRKFDNDDTIIKKFDTQPSIIKIKNISEYNNEIGITTSVLLSPVPSETRRRLASKADNLNSPSSSQASPKDSERIMFVNEIVYDYPNLINDIMKQTLVKYPDISKANQTESPNLNHSTTTEPLNSEKSVIHRPRPIQRRMSRFLTTGRRRSKSLFVPKTNSNIALSNVTCLDPLPKPQPLPTRAANLKRLLPDDSKNMDNEDRIKYLFPAPPAPPTNLKNMPNVMRRLSLPSLHLIPSSQNYDNLKNFSRPEQEFADFREPEVISKQTFKTQKPKNNESNQIPQTELSSNVYMTDLNTEKIQKLPRTSKLSKTDVNVPDKNLIYSEEKHFEALQSSLSQTPIDDDLSDWDWLAEFDPLQSKNNSRSRSVDEVFSSEDENSRLSFDLNENEEGQEIVTFMLEPSSLFNNEVNRAKQHSVTADLTQNRQENLRKNQEIQIPSFKINQKSIPILAEMKKSWNFSVGESIPSFSEKREESSQVHRKPPALILNDKNIDQGAIFQNSQLTPPSEPPASLNERDQLSISTVDLQQRESLGSIIQRFPMAFSSQDSGQTPLLRKLEIEIEEQSNHWHDMQNDLDRSSIFTTSSLQNKFMRGSKRLLTSSYMANVLRSPQSRISISSSLSRDIAIDSWQQKLAETQNSYTNLYDQRSNRFTLLNIRLSSPTPPGSLHSESNSISEDLTDIETPNSKTFAEKCEHTMLWSPNSLPSRKVNRGLWNTLTVSSIGTNGDPPARNLRPQKRFVRQNLSISSSNLWMKKKLTNINSSPVGLWCLNPSSPGKIVNSQEATEKTKIDVNIIDSDEVMDEILGNAEEFDESILIKIASILKISNIPSKKSLMPPAFDEQSDHKFANLVSHPTDFPFPIKVSDFKAKISKPTLWSRFNHTQIINRSIGLPEPSPEVWEALNCSSRSFIRSKTRQLEDLPILGPKTLWIKSKTKDHNRISDKVWITHETFKNSESKKADLWTPRTHHHTTYTRKSGLFSVPKSGLLIRSTQMSPSGHQISKKGRNVVGGLSTLSSKDLWVAKQNPIIMTNWISVNCVEQSHKSNFTSSPKKNMLLWTPKTHHHTTDTRKSGLFSVPKSGLLIRSTQMSPSGHQISKKGRNVVGGLSTLSSKDLWVAKQNPIIMTNWISVNCVEQSHKSNFTSSPKKNMLLWTPKTHHHTTDTRKSGLFSVPKSGLLIRSTQMPPSGHQISKKGRNVVGGLSTLSSKDLWVAKQNPIIMTNWISVNCVEQSHKSNFTSSPKKNMLLWTPKTHHHTTDTRKSGLFSVPKSGLLIRSTQMSPSGHQISKKGRNVVGGLSTLSSKDLWVAKQNPIIMTNWISVNCVEQSHKSNFTSSPKKNMLLWTPKTHHHTTDTRKSGLFSVPKSGLLIRSTQMPPSGHQISKKGRNVVGGLSTLSSKDLWVAKQNPIIMTNWISVNCVEQSHKSNFTSSPKKNMLLWTPKTHHHTTDTRKSGLFSVPKSGLLIRSTQMSPSGHQISKKGRNVVGGLSTLSSKDLWVAKQNPIIMTNWISVNCVEQSHKSNFTSSPKKNMLLWTPKTHHHTTDTRKSGLFSVPKSGLLIRSTQMSPSGHQISKKGRNVVGGLSTLSSKDLWVAKQNPIIMTNWISVNCVEQSHKSNFTSSPKKNMLLWTPKTHHHTTDTRKSGLFSVPKSGLLIRSTQMPPSGHQISKKGRNVVGGLSTLSSKDLWVAKQNPIIMTNWISVNCVEQSHKSNFTSSPKKNMLLWTPKTHHHTTDTRKSGLFSVPKSGLLIRSTQMPPSGHQISKKGRNVVGGLSTLSSKDLWVAKQNPIIMTNWISVNCVEQSHKSNFTSSPKKNMLLWTPKTHHHTTDTRKSGLFSVPKSGLLIRSTQMSPSGHQISKKGRNVVGGLSTLSSKDLWVAKQNPIIMTNWISVNCVEQSHKSNFTSSPKKNMLLWTPKTHHHTTYTRKSGLFSVPKSGLLIRSTQMSPSGHQISKKGRNVVGGLSTLSSKDLWVAKQNPIIMTNWISVNCVEQSHKSNFTSSPKKNMLLWTPKTHHHTTDTRKSGLFSVPKSGLLIRSTQMPPSGHQISKKGRNVVGGLSTLSSKDLWVAKQNPIIMTNWISVNCVEQSHKSNFTSSPKKNMLLWTPKTHHHTTDTRKSGLFSVPKSGLLIRSTQMSPSGHQISKKGRNVVGGLSTLSSKDLWFAKSNPITTTNWISVACVEKRRESDLISSSKKSDLLWTKKPALTSRITTGIFDPSFSISSYYQMETSSTLPGVTPRRPHLFETPLDRLVSNRLWEKEDFSLLERDWISESSIRPHSRTNSLSYSVSSSSSRSEISSIFSMSTRASSIWTTHELSNYSAIPLPSNSISERNLSEKKS